VTTTAGALVWDPRRHGATSPLGPSGSASAADARKVAARVRASAIRGRLLTDARRASITQVRLDAATVRLRAAGQRGRSARRDRGDLADTRDDAANERDLIADDRDAIADSRDAAADLRDQAAEERDRMIEIAFSSAGATPAARRLSVDSLTGREQEVLALIADGRSNHAISGSLGVETKTVEAHIASIFSKLELSPGLNDHRRVLAVLAHLGVPLP
jgi:ATP/maltotriose-dependent transcriptional regulator MalT